MKTKKYSEKKRNVENLILSYPDISNYLEWDVFSHVFSDIMKLFAVETNHYAHEEKNKLHADY